MSRRRSAGVRAGGRAGGRATGRWQRRITVVLLVIYLLLLTGVILFKLPFYSPSLIDERAINLVPLMGSFDEGGALVLREIVYNILLFVPLGVYVSMLRPKWRFLSKLAPVLCLTFAFEALQFAFELGRSDITDILANTLGGLLGICLYALLARLLKTKALLAANLVALVATAIAVARFAQLFFLSHFVMMPT